MVVRWPWRLWVCALALYCIAAGVWSATQFLFCPEWAHWISHPDRHTSRPVTIARQAAVSSPGVVYTLDTPGSRSGSEGEFLQNGAVSCACSLSVLGLGFWVTMSMFISTFPRHYRARALHRLLLCLSIRTPPSFPFSSRTPSLQLSTSFTHTHRSIFIGQLLVVCPHPVTCLTCYICFVSSSLDSFGSPVHRTGIFWRFSARHSISFTTRARPWVLSGRTGLTH